MSSSIRTYYQAFLRSQEFLLNCKNTSFPLNIHQLVEQQENVLLQTKSEYYDWCLAVGKVPVSCIEDAKCFYYANAKTYLIVYDENKHWSRIRFSLAHELGHIVLGHLNDERTELSRGGVPDYLYSKMEGEANTFAGNLLAPPILIHQYKDLLPRVDESTIKGLFKLSAPAAKWRLSDYMIWKTLTITDIERKLLEKYWKISVS